MRFRAFAPSDLDAYAALRLRALREHPRSYTAEADAWERAARATLERHLVDSADGTQPILGAWRDAIQMGLLRREFNR